jgi:AcrR family transcriptional regulator
MENSTRSERTREAAVKAALRIIARDGISHLTLDAIARETGVSKGAITHQFKSKHEVLKALFAHEMAYFAAFKEEQLAKGAHAASSPTLAVELAISRNILTNPNSAALAVMGAVAEEPELMAPVRAISAEMLAQLRTESDDPDIAVLRWVASRGLALMALFGISPLSEAEHDRLFALLMDDAAWARPVKRKKK